MRNELKFRVLSFLASRGKQSATAAEIAWGIRLVYPKRGLYPHLARYHHWGLILVSQSVRGVKAYRIGERGRARLAWLSRCSI